MFSTSIFRSNTRLRLPTRRTLLYLSHSFRKIMSLAVVHRWGQRLPAEWMEYGAKMSDQRWVRSFSFSRRVWYTENYVFARQRYSRHNWRPGSSTPYKCGLRRLKLRCSQRRSSWRRCFPRCVYLWVVPFRWSHTAPSTASRRRKLWSPRHPRRRLASRRRPTYGRSVSRGIALRRS